MNAYVEIVFDNLMATSVDKKEDGCRFIISSFFYYSQSHTGHSQTYSRCEKDEFSGRSTHFQIGRSYWRVPIF